MTAPDIHIWRTARATWRRLFFNNIGNYVRVSCIPFAIVLAANIAMAAIGIGGAPAGPAADMAELLHHLAGILIEWTVWLAMVPVAAAWIRTAHDGTPPRIAFGAAERAFAARHLMFILLIFATVTLPGRLTHGIGQELRAAIGAYPMSVAQAAALPVALVGVAVTLRLSLLLPAAALRQPLPPGTSWRLVRTRELTVAGALIAASLPLIPLQFIVAMATDGHATSTAGGVAAVALRKTVILWLAWPVWATALALLYARLTERKPATISVGSDRDATPPATARPRA